VEADPIHNSQTVPIVVLVGVESVSYGEIFPGVLKDLGRAKIVGQTTLGNVEVLH
jgi:C-terminal processing protease CtpA/Prc